MPRQVSPLAEYLLAVNGPNGGPLCRLGILQTTVPVFPPLTTITFLMKPVPNSYMSIEIWWQLSPSMVPGVFTIDVKHQGMQRAGGTIGTSVLRTGGFNVWLEITENQFSSNTIRNISGAAQFLEALDFYLIIDNETNYKILKDLIAQYGRGRATPLAP